MGQRKRRKKRWRKRGDLESRWASRRRMRWRVLRNWMGLGCAILLVALLVGLVRVWSSQKKPDSFAKGVGTEDESPEVRLKHEIEEAEAVARKFLAETDPATRLQWVREEDAVRMRMEGYSGEARESPGEIEKMIGHVSEDGRTITAFAVAMPSGNMRLLEVVTAEDGPQVDWDAYARHGTAAWEDLWSGKARRAVVRVFCEPATERPEPFGDQAKWTCFRMSGPDLPQAALAFAAVGSVREEMMKKVILGTPRYRQRFVLEIVRHEGKDEPLFEIARCHAVGWIEADRAVEEEWAAE